ncbi:MAG: hypothetical protein FDX18_10585 [Chlorobium sp.]|nr:MAG: hypothetical protein FDX18_10585 [Chlorobium sp.]
MTAMSEKNKIGIRFHGFRFLRFAFEQQDDIDTGEDFDIELGTNIDVDKSTIVVNVLATFSRKSSDKIVAQIETASLFQIKGIEPSEEQEEPPKYPEGLLVTAISLAISTTRGAIIAKGCGSFLEHFLLPIVDPKTFLPKPDDQSKLIAEDNNT